jgi:hypothetical protein
MDAVVSPTLGASSPCLYVLSLGMYPQFVAMPHLALCFCRASGQQASAAAVGFAAAAGASWTLGPGGVSWCLVVWVLIGE